MRRTFFIALLPAVVGVLGPLAAEAQECLIDRGAIVNGGVGRDGIPALTSSRAVTAEESLWMRDSDLVLGVAIHGEARACPHRVLWWHEISEDMTLLLTFEAIDPEGAALRLRDRETHSIWNLRGEATEGELSGLRLTRIPTYSAFWFAWAAFSPQTEIYARSTP